MLGKKVFISLSPFKFLSALNSRIYRNKNFYSGFDSHSWIPFSPKKEKNWKSADSFLSPTLSLLVVYTTTRAEGEKFKLFQRNKWKILSTIWMRPSSVVPPISSSVRALLKFNLRANSSLCCVCIEILRTEMRKEFLCCEHASEIIEISH